MKVVFLAIYGRDWLAFSRNLRSPLEILVANVGHGDCTGIFGSKNSLLVDFGTREVKKYAWVADYVKQLMDAKDEHKLVISHYHSDHYSLLKRLPLHYFHESYLPALPPKTSIGGTLLKAIAFFIVLRYHRYFLVPEILRTSRRIRPIVRGNQFTAANLNWEVMWPDYGLLEQTPWVRNMVGRLRDRISEILVKLSEEQRRHFDKIYEELSTSFASEGVPNYRESIWENVTEEYQPYNLMQDKSLRRLLEEIENEFRTLANYTTLIVRNSLFLFTGDADNKILDFVKLNDQQYLFVKASHHGKYYGRGLDSLFTVMLAVSRDEKMKVNPKYLQSLRWSILIDTAQHGTCSIIIP